MPGLFLPRPPWSSSCSRSRVKVGRTKCTFIPLWYRSNQRAPSLSRLYPPLAQTPTCPCPSESAPVNRWMRPLFHGRNMEAQKSRYASMRVEKEKAEDCMRHTGTKETVAVACRAEVNAGRCPIFLSTRVKGAHAVCSDRRASLSPIDRRSRESG